MKYKITFKIFNEETQAEEEREQMIQAESQREAERLFTNMFPDAINPNIKIEE